MYATCHEKDSATNMGLSSFPEQYRQIISASDLRDLSGKRDGTNQHTSTTI